MKKLFVATLIALVALTGCSQANAPKEASQAVETSTPTPTPKPLDLTGTWISDGMTATISGDTITINWTSNGTTALYWQGTYTPPTESVDEYSWTSQNDTSATSGAIMASSDSTKDFTYKNGEITFTASAMGVTSTIHLKKQ